MGQERRRPSTFVSYTEGFTFGVEGLAPCAREPHDASSHPLGNTKKPVCYAND